MTASTVVLNNCLRFAVKPFSRFFFVFRSRNIFYYQAQIMACLLLIAKNTPTAGETEEKFAATMLINLVEIRFLFLINLLVI